MITEAQYTAYRNALLDGSRPVCARLVRQLLEKRIDIKALYTDLFQKSLYEVGELWESNRITVAREHLATAITESVLNLVYPELFTGELCEKKAVISCTANEYHQVGGKMVADIFEVNGWDAHFLGANTPVDQLLAFIDEERPNMVGLSVSIYFNMPSLKTALDALSSTFPCLDIIVGGQAFRWGGTGIVKTFRNTEWVPTLHELEHLIAGVS